MPRVGFHDDGRPWTEKERAAYQAYFAEIGKEAWRPVDTSEREPDEPVWDYGRKRKATAAQMRDEEHVRLFGTPYYGGESAVKSALRAQKATRPMNLQEAINEGIDTGLLNTPLIGSLLRGTARFAEDKRSTWGERALGLVESIPLAGEATAAAVRAAQGKGLSKWGRGPLQGFHQRPTPRIAADPRPLPTSGKIASGATSFAGSVAMLAASPFNAVGTLGLTGYEAGSRGMTEDEATLGGLRGAAWGAATGGVLGALPAAPAGAGLLRRMGPSTAAITGMSALQLREQYRETGEKPTVGGVAEELAKIAAISVAHQVAGGLRRSLGKTGRIKAKAKAELKRDWPRLTKRLRPKERFAADKSVSGEDARKIRAAVREIAKMDPDVGDRVLVVVRGKDRPIRKGRVGARAIVIDKRNPLRLPVVGVDSKPARRNVLHVIEIDEAAARMPPKDLRGMVAEEFVHTKGHMKGKLPTRPHTLARLDEEIRGKRGGKKLARAVKEGEAEERAKKLEQEEKARGKFRKLVETEARLKDQAALKGPPPTTLEKIDRDLAKVRRQQQHAAPGSAASRLLAEQERTLVARRAKARPKPARGTGSPQAAVAGEAAPPTDAEALKRSIASLGRQKRRAKPGSQAQRRLAAKQRALTSKLRAMTGERVAKAEAPPKPQTIDDLQRAAIATGKAEGRTFTMGQRWMIAASRDWPPPGLSGKARGAWKRSSPAKRKADAREFLAKETQAWALAQGADAAKAKDVGGRVAALMQAENPYVTDLAALRKATLAQMTAKAPQKPTKARVVPGKQMPGQPRGKLALSDAEQRARWLRERAKELKVERKAGVRREQAPVAEPPKAEPTPRPKPPLLARMAEVLDRLEQQVQTTKPGSKAHKIALGRFRKWQKRFDQESAALPPSGKPAEKVPAPPPKPAGKPVSVPQAPKAGTQTPLPATGGTQLTRAELERMSFDAMRAHAHKETKGVGRNKGKQYRKGTIIAAAEDGTEHNYSVRVRNDGVVTIKDLGKTRAQIEKQTQQEWEALPQAIRDKVETTWPDQNRTQQEILGRLASGQDVSKPSVMAVLRGKAATKFQELFPSATTIPGAKKAMKAWGKQAMAAEGAAAGARLGKGVEALAGAEGAKPTEPAMTTGRRNALNLVRESTMVVGERTRQLDKFTRKAPGAKLTKAELAVMAKADKGLDLPWLSKTIAFSDKTRYWPVRDKQALLSLLERGSLEAYKTPDGKTWRIVRAGAHPKYMAEPPPSEAPPTEIGQRSMSRKRFDKLYGKDPKAAVEAVKAADEAMEASASRNTGTGLLDRAGRRLRAAVGGPAARDRAGWFERRRIRTQSDVLVPMMGKSKKATMTRISTLGDDVLDRIARGQLEAMRGPRGQKIPALDLTDPRIKEALRLKHDMGRADIGFFTQTSTSIDRASESLGIAPPVQRGLHRTQTWKVKVLNELFPKGLRIGMERISIVNDAFKMPRAEAAKVLKPLELKLYDNWHTGKYGRGYLHRVNVSSGLLEPGQRLERYWITRADNGDIVKVPVRSGKMPRKAEPGFAKTRYGGAEKYIEDPISLIRGYVRQTAQFRFMEPARLEVEARARFMPPGYKSLTIEYMKRAMGVTDTYRPFAKSWPGAVDRRAAQTIYYGALVAAPGSAMKNATQTLTGTLPEIGPAATAHGIKMAYSPWRWTKKIAQYYADKGVTDTWHPIYLEQLRGTYERIGDVGMTMFAVIEQRNRIVAWEGGKYHFKKMYAAGKMDKLYKGMLSETRSQVKALLSQAKPAVERAAEVYAHKVNLKTQVGYGVAYAPLWFTKVHVATQFLQYPRGALEQVTDYIYRGQPGKAMGVVGVHAGLITAMGAAGVSAKHAFGGGVLPHDFPPVVKAIIDGMDLGQAYLRKDEKRKQEALRELKRAAPLAVPGGRIAMKLYRFREGMLNNWEFRDDRGGLKRRAYLSKELLKLFDLPPKDEQRDRDIVAGEMQEVAKERAAKPRPPETRELTSLERWARGAGRERYEKMRKENPGIELRPWAKLREIGKKERKKERKKKPKERKKKPKGKAWDLSGR